MSIRVVIEIVRDGPGWTASSHKLGLITCGDTLPDLANMIGDCMAMLFELHTTWGSLDQLLEQLSEDP